MPHDHGLRARTCWLRHCPNVGTASRRPADAWLNPEALRRTVELIERDLASDLRVSRLAEVAGLGTSAFVRGFRGSVGTTPAAFVLRMRLERAEGLLRQTGMPVADIAARSGFGSATHFSTAFKERHGIAPRSYRSGGPR
jgi:AraC family transcriptional regulator